MFTSFDTSTSRAHSRNNILGIFGIMTYIVFVIKDHDSPIIAAVSMQSRTDTQIHVCRLGDALKSSA